MSRILLGRGAWVLRARRYLSAAGEHSLWSRLRAPTCNLRRRDRLLYDSRRILVAANLSPFLPRALLALLCYTYLKEDIY